MYPHRTSIETHCPDLSAHSASLGLGQRSEPSWPAQAPANEALHVLSVGRLEHEALLREALGEMPQVVVNHASDYRELWNLSKENRFDAVLFHNSLCSFELEEASRLVRGRWPAAKILIIRSGEMSLDDPLYDHRIVPPADAKLVMAVLSSVTHRRKDGPEQHAA